MIENTYNVFADLFDTFQSLDNWLKLIVIITPPLFIIAMFGLYLRYRLAIKAPQYNIPDKLTYSIHHLDNDHVMTYRYDTDGNPHHLKHWDNEADAQERKWQNILDMEMEFDENISQRIDASELKRKQSNNSS